MNKARKSWKKWTNAEKRELKRICKQVRSWKELRSELEKSRILKDRNYRNELRRKAMHLNLTRHFTDRRAKVSKEKEVRNKQFLFSKSEKIAPAETFKIETGVWDRKSTNIGLISRIDFGSKGFRAGLIKLALEKTAQHGLRFNILVGGLVNKKVLKKKLRDRIKELNDRLRGLRLSVEEKREERAQEKDDFYFECARELARLIPQVKKPNGKPVKLYMFTSSPFDGKIGDEIARRLAALRKDNDIVYWGFNPEYPLLVKHVNKTLFPVVSQRQSWMRSDYYSTPVQRELKDLLKRSSMELSDIYTVGCFASSVFKPEGDSRVPYMSLPAIHKLDETRTSENQIGIRIVKFRKNRELTVKTISFKDLIREERKLITIPSSCSEFQSAIIKQLKIAPMSSGVLEYHLKENPRWRNITRKDVIKAIEDLKRFRAGINFDNVSNLFDFSSEWFQKKAPYEMPEEDKLAEDTFVACSCLHTGAPQTNYRFIVEAIPNYIIQTGAKYLVLSGDIIQGTYHRMLEKGQIYRGLNYTYQEKLAAGLMGIVITKVFETRFSKAIRNKKELNQDELKKLISDSLVTFIYLEGNHDAWERSGSFVPLVVFEQDLINFIVREIKKTLKKFDVRINGVHGIVVNKIIQDDPIEQIFYRTPSGLAVKVGHPYTGRSITASISGEKFMKMHLESHLNFVGNWHVGLSMEHFDQEIGQRVYVQLPTIQRYTLFETNKMKKTDFGVGICRVKSLNGRVVTSETGFYGDRFYGDAQKNLKKIDNEIIDEILVKLGVPLS